MSNGCICCTLREDLMIEVEKLAKEGKFDYLIIESTGISEPVPVAQTFSFVDDESGIDLSRFAFIDTMVTVVDALNFGRTYGTADTVATLGLHEADENDARPIVNLLTEQIEFADVIILNKTDLVEPTYLGELKAMLKALNPRAKLLESSFGKVPLNQVVNTGFFDITLASQTDLWQKELAMAGKHTPETEEYGFGSFVFRDKKPFHPMRFFRYVNSNWPVNILRSKGLFWLASRRKNALMWNQAGGSLRAEPAGFWWSGLDREERETHPSFIENRTSILSRWDNEFGDCVQEIVIIGQDLDQDSITNELKACQLTDDELQLWKANKLKLEDPWQL